MNFLELLQYGFVQRALLAGVLVAISCSCLGGFLVLRRFSLIGDGIAHVSFATVALGLLLRQEPLLISLPLVALISMGIMKLEEKARIYGDAAIGMVSAFSVSLGVILASCGGGFSVDLFSYLFGNILAVSRTEVLYAGVVAGCVIGVVIYFYHDFFATTFDEEYAAMSGIPVGRINKLLIVLTACTVVLGIKVVGTLLVSSLIVIPAVTALQCARSFRSVIALSVVLSCVAVIGGIAIALLLNVPAGAMIVQVNIVFFMGAFFYRLMTRKYVR